MKGSPISHPSLVDQEEFTKVYLVPSDRKDVVEGPWPEFIVPQEGVEYIDIYSEDWQRNSQRKNSARIKELLGL